MSRATLALVAALLALPAGASAQVSVSVGGVRGRMVERALVSSLEDAGVTVRDGSPARVEGEVSRARRRGFRVQVALRDASGAEVVSRELVDRSLGGLNRALGRWARSTLAPAIGGLGAAPAPAAEAPAPRSARAPTPAPAAARDEVEPQPAAARSSSARVPPFAFHGAVAITSRQLTYTDDIFSSLRPYSLPAGPVIRLALEWFPGAHFDSGAFGGFSVTARGELMVGVSTVDGNGVSYPTEAWGFGLDLRYRLRVDDVALGVTAGYGTNTFALRDADELSPRPRVPNVEYHDLRAGGSFRWDIGLGLFVDVEAAYRHPLAAGEILSSAWFFRGQVGGLDGAAGFGLRVDDVQLAARFEIVRYWYDMRSEPGDDPVAGGAVDERLAGSLSLVYTPSGL